MEDDIREGWRSVGKTWEMLITSTSLTIREILAKNPSYLKLCLKKYKGFKYKGLDKEFLIKIKE